MRKTLFALSIILGTSIFIPQTSNAQFKRNKSRNNSPTNNTSKNVVTPTSNKAVVSETKQKIDPQYPNSIIKDLYNIDVLIPLGLSNYSDPNLNKYKLPAATLGYLQFYEGLTIAAKHLNKEGIKIDLHITDIQGVNKKPSQLIQAGKLNNSDAIVGLVGAEFIGTLANFAQQKKINFLSVISPADANVRNNPYMMITQPTLSTHIEKLVRYSEKEFKNANQTVITYQPESNKAAIDYFNRALDNKHINKIDLQNNLSNIVDILPKLSENKVNNIYLPIINPSDANEILKNLAHIPDNYKINIFGLPSWVGITGLKQTDFLPAHITVYHSVPFYFQNQPYSFVEDYKHQYKIAPSEMAYRGYETLMYLAKALNKNGTIFNTNLNNPMFRSATPFEFKHQFTEKSDYKYIENEHLYILQFNSGQSLVH